ncbi:MAG: ATP synthase F1 subunit gamma [Patescibacteria group bacterium]|nr:ATP synthase F1 subunit gamma [Patescibacteria group bacterium]
MNLRILRKKIKSINNVKKITKAMQLVSAIKMKKAQQEAIEGLPYRSFLKRVIQKTASSLTEKTVSPLLISHTNNKKSLWIVISSNKGLCGFFNFSIFRLLLNEVDFKKDEFLVIGKKGALFIAKLGGKIVADFSHFKPSLVVSAVFFDATNRFLRGDYEKVFLIYNKFINPFKFETSKESLLPATIATIENNIESQLTNKEYLIEPDPKRVIEEAIKNLVEEKIREAIIESQASEHSARMIAMKNATDNASEIVSGLNLLKNKVRQEKITYELLDMISAKISVENLPQ